jgi:hypothetical protein
LRHICRITLALYHLITNTAMSSPTKISIYHSFALHTTGAIRAKERLSAAQQSPFALIQKAGTSIAKLAMALMPHARCIWIACGPGNNGADGLIAAAQLASFGYKVAISHLESAQRHTPHWQMAWQQMPEPQLAMPHLWKRIWALTPFLVSVTPLARQRHYPMHTLIGCTSLTMGDLQP